MGVVWIPYSTKTGAGNDKVMHFFLQLCVVRAEFGTPDRIWQCEVGVLSRVNPKRKHFYDAKHFPRKSAQSLALPWFISFVTSTIGFVDKHVV